MNAQRSPDDWLTAREIHEQYGMPLRVAQSLVRNRDRKGKAVRLDDFRRVMIRRSDVEPQSSGGTTCE